MFYGIIYLLLHLLIILILLIFTQEFSYYNLWEINRDFLSAVMGLLISPLSLVLPSILGEFYLYKKDKSKKEADLSYSLYPILVPLFTLFLLSLNFFIPFCNVDCSFQIGLMILLGVPGVFALSYFRSKDYYDSRNDHKRKYFVEELENFIVRNFKKIVSILLIITIVLVSLILFDFSTKGQYIKLSDSDNSKYWYELAVANEDISYCQKSINGMLKHKTRISCYSDYFEDILASHPFESEQEALDYISNNICEAEGVGSQRCNMVAEQRVKYYKEFS